MPKQTNKQTKNGDERCTDKFVWSNQSRDEANHKKIFDDDCCPHFIKPPSPNQSPLSKKNSSLRKPEKKEVIGTRRTGGMCVRAGGGGGS
jgi:hypothetical protein